MAQELKLRRNAVNTSLINTSGFHILDPGWIPKVADYTEGRVLPVNEVLTIESCYGTQDALAAGEIILNKLGGDAVRYIQDRTEQHPVWLHDKLDSETGERRALVRKMKLERLTEQHGSGEMIAAKPIYRLGIEREGLWERTTARDLPEAYPAALRFDSGSTEPTVGETVTGNTTGHVGTLSGYHLAGGAWGAGTAAGTLYFSDTDGSFQNNEALNGSTSGADFATADGTRTGAAALVYDYTQAGSAVAAHDVVGDAPARIEHLRIEPAMGAVGMAVGRCWIGARSANKHGTLTNFMPIWELEDGVNGTDAADVVDATASDGNLVRITPGTATWASRLEIRLEHATSNPADNFGCFLWLLRTKVSVGKWEVQARYGYGGMASGEKVLGRIVEVDSTSWNYLELDVQSVPLRDLRVIPTSVYAASYEDNFEIEIFARRTSGAGTLDLDCLCSLPIDEGFMKAWGFTATNPGQVVSFGEGPNGKRAVLYANVTGGSFAEFVAFSAPGFRLPADDGRLIVVHARETTSDITDHLLISDSDTGGYYESWYTLRGAE